MDSLTAFFIAALCGYLALFVAMWSPHCPECPKNKKEK